MKQLEPISAVLKILAELHPNLSKELTKRIPKSLKGTREGKLRKVEILVEYHDSIFVEIAQRIYPADPESTNPLGYSSNSLINSIQKLIKHERESGSFGSRYDFGQGEVE